jgi:hypothetical protein
MALSRAAKHGDEESTVMSRSQQGDVSLDASHSTCFPTDESKEEAVIEHTRSIYRL